MNQFNNNIDLPQSTVGSNDELVRIFRSIVGKKHVITNDSESRRFRTGFRFGAGKALAVVRPGSLVEQWQVLKAAVSADKIIIMQAANTGLTGGSTPFGDDYDRDVVLINTMRINKVQVINGGKQVVCLPGATLDQLEQVLKPLGREPHSVIGSSCIGASVLGGVCNNSGGALVKRGPVYTELALFAQQGADGILRLVNHLGIDLGDEPEAILHKLDHGAYDDGDVRLDAGKASDDRYAMHVRDVNADTPARFNADSSRLYEASGSAGKLCVFAVRLDTFPVEVAPVVFYIGANRTETMAQLRKRLLTDLSDLPIAGEYMHRDAYDIAAEYGKDTFLMIDHLGTKRLPSFFALKSKMDDFCRRVPLIPDQFADLAMQALSKLFPRHLPARMDRYRDLFEHHLAVKVPGGLKAETEALLKDFFVHTSDGDFFECDPDEGRKAFLHRFAAAGAAVRYRAIHSKAVEDIVALDIALKRNDEAWFETLPQNIDQKIIMKLYYGHFLCNVFHQDYVVTKGVNCHALEHEMLELLDQRGAKYPAEHNVGHLYQAPPSLADFYQELDPCNQFNSGIGQTSKCSHWR